MKKLILLPFVALLSSPLSACEKNKWKITRESYENIIELDSQLMADQL